MEEPLPSLHPMPTEHSSASFAPVTIAPAPMFTHLPTTLSTTTALSLTLDMAPISTVPFTREPYHAEAPSPSLTAPTRLAEGATKLAPATAGALPPSLTPVVGMGSFSTVPQSPCTPMPTASIDAPIERKAEPTAYQKAGGPGGRAAHARACRWRGEIDICTNRGVISVSFATRQGEVTRGQK